jgi:hypothetical protein
MPLKRLLDEDRSFDSKDVAILLTAYEKVVPELGLLTSEEKERAARLVIRLAAGQTDLDAVKLREAVTSSMMN